MTGVARTGSPVRVTAGRDLLRIHALDPQRLHVFTATERWQEP